MGNLPTSIIPATVDAAFDKALSESGLILQGFLGNASIGSLLNSASIDPSGNINVVGINLSGAITWTINDGPYIQSLASGGINLNSNFVQGPLYTTFEFVSPYTSLPSLSSGAFAFAMDYNTSTVHTVWSQGGVTTVMQLNTTGAWTLLYADGSGTPGLTATSNYPSGRLALSTGGSAIVVTCSAVTTANCIVTIVPEQVDTAAPCWACVNSGTGGTFTVTTYSNVGIATPPAATWKFKYVVNNT